MMGWFRDQGGGVEVPSWPVLSPRRGGPPPPIALHRVSGKADRHSMTENITFPRSMDLIGKYGCKCQVFLQIRVWVKLHSYIFIQDFSLERQGDEGPWIRRWLVQWSLLHLGKNPFCLFPCQTSKTNEQWNSGFVIMYSSFPWNRSFCQNSHQ